VPVRQESAGRPSLQRSLNPEGTDWSRDRRVLAARATRLCDQGRAFVSQNNPEGLRNVVLELWKLMPADAVERRKRGYQSGVVKGRV
jgi:hypothetical protein